MSSYSERDTYSHAGGWLLGTMRRNPEALLLMAAGCCLMMRSGRSSSRLSSRAPYERDEWQYQPSSASSPKSGEHQQARVKDSRARPTPPPIRHKA